MFDSRQSPARLHPFSPLARHSLRPSFFSEPAALVRRSAGGRTSALVAAYDGVPSQVYPRRPNGLRWITAPHAPLQRSAPPSPPRRGNLPNRPIASVAALPTPPNVTRLTPRRAPADRAGRTGLSTSAPPESSHRPSAQAPSAVATGGWAGGCAWAPCNRWRCGPVCCGPNLVRPPPLTVPRRTSAQISCQPPTAIVPSDLTATRFPHQNVVMMEGRSSTATPGSLPFARAPGMSAWLTRHVFSKATPQLGAPCVFSSSRTSSTPGCSGARRRRPSLAGPNRHGWRHERPPPHHCRRQRRLCRRRNPPPPPPPLLMTTGWPVGIAADNNDGRCHRRDGRREGCRHRHGRIQDAIYAKISTEALGRLHQSYVKKVGHPHPVVVTPGRFQTDSWQPRGGRCDTRLARKHTPSYRWRVALRDRTGLLVSWSPVGAPAHTTPVNLLLFRGGDRGSQTQQCERESLRV